MTYYFRAPLLAETGSGVFSFDNTQDYRITGLRYHDGDSLSDVIR